MIRFRLKKTLGQYFLKNTKFLMFLANSLGVIHNETIIEIGGGSGNLTQFLLSAKKLIVYEIDKNLSKFLEERFKNYKNVKIINKDFLKSNLKKFNNDFLLIGNIPYFITGKILRKIFNKDNHPKIAVLVLQKEYGQKILGENGNNFLHCFIRNFTEIKKIMVIKNKYFFPTPKVDSIALKFSFYSQPLISEVEDFEMFLKRFFINNKRTVLNNLKRFYSKEIYKIKDKNLLLKRPRNLSLKEIFDMFFIFKKK
ncbi:MAG: ribosomal RNA small subunit methyltransferase A [Candidatus Parcubacteria bacterium]|nr:MAG: ribosomal RNA small subunit methyltransferase A [Candidatus Parcubacteria bacterium]